MRFGSDLTSKALLALEQAVQRCRYQHGHGDYAVRFALAYLWVEAGAGNTEPFIGLWRELASTNDVFRWSEADDNLRRIYGVLGLPRNEAVGEHMWRLAGDEEAARQAEIEQARRRP